LKETQEKRHKSPQSEKKKKKKKKKKKEKKRESTDPRHRAWGTANVIPLILSKAKHHLTLRIATPKLDRNTLALWEYEFV